MVPASRRARIRASALGLLCALASCAVPGPSNAPPPVPPTWTVPQGYGPAFTPVAYNQIPGWTTDASAPALAAFVVGCKALTKDPNQQLGGIGTAQSAGGISGQWLSACAGARNVPPDNDAAARSFFEANFQAYGISADSSAEGLFTGYYEPEVAGSRIPDKTYKYPIYRRPPDLNAPGHSTYLTRAQIDKGALDSKRLDLLWLTDPIDVFFLQVQGAGRVRLPDGHIVRVTYDGQNGQTYVPIGRVLVDRGEMTLDQVSMQSIRAWLVAHPSQEMEVMEQNPSYVFFREVPELQPNAGAPGSLGAPLTPNRSIAVDKAVIPLGAPVFLNTKDALDGSAYQHLMVAQDLGGAIRGAVRADIFFGWGPDAEARAGKMRQQGTAYLLLPKGG